MLVYGDVEWVEELREKRDALKGALDRVSRMTLGLDRHMELVATFIDLAELVQGVADAEFEDCCCDALSSTQEAGMRCLVLAAQAVSRSWSSKFRDGGELAAIIESLQDIEGPATIRTKQAEGYAFYALYPEAFIEAARQSGLSCRTCVIGIRSIGVGLAALVAAAIGAPPPVTLRPAGHPFRRKVRIDPALEQAMLADLRDFAIVDEGPGLSGSSFGAVLDWLEAHGVKRERIHVFPSHKGDLGPRASDEHRARWTQIQRHCVAFEEQLAERLQAWVEDRVGTLDAPLEEISGGRWRALRYADPSLWPATDLQQERRKFIARGGGDAWLAKFVGLGRAGASKIALAQRFADAGFTPTVTGLCHGFLLERWIEDARSLDQTEVDRQVLINGIAAYLSFRIRLPAEEAHGASADELLRMAQHNTLLILGEAAARRLHFDPAMLEARMHRVVTDNRMLPHEWLLTREGHILKTDAIDHHAAHDLIGCQDITWDVVGAGVEFGFSDEDTMFLARRVERETGRRVDSLILSFLMRCYLAFRSGACSMAADAVGGDEAARLRAAASRYANLLARCLGA